MDKILILQLVKSRLGLSSSNIKDIELISLIDGVIYELEDEKGIILEAENSCHIEFIKDYSVWRYQNRDSEKGIPRYLQFRMNNLMVHNGGDATV